MEKIAEIKITSPSDPYVRPIGIYVEEVFGGSGEDYMLMIHLPLLPKLGQTLKNSIYQLAWKKIKTWQAQQKAGTPPPAPAINEPKPASPAPSLDDLLKGE
jgi:hypothetical protein